MPRCYSCEHFRPELSNRGGDYWFCTNHKAHYIYKALCVCPSFTEKTTRKTSLGANPTNPKDACGIKKVPTWFIPTQPMLEVGLAMMEGARKYGAFNWRKAGVRMSVYYDAIKRHLDDWKEGEDIDPDSGIHHLMKAAACCMIVRDSILMGNCEDDRPIRYPNGLDIKGMNKQAEGLIEKYPECAKPFLETDKDEHSRFGKWAI